MHPVANGSAGSTPARDPDPNNRETNVNTATLLKTYTHPLGVQKTYQLSPPIRRESECCACGNVTHRDVKHVVVSASIVPDIGPETFIFEGAADGQITHWIEMAGSARNTLDHAEVLRNAGYEVAP